MIVLRRNAAVSILLLALLVALAPTGAAQADTVVLKNGAVLIGKITRETDKEVSIRDAIGTWTFQRYEIARIERQGAAGTALEQGRSLLNENAIDRAIEKLELARTANPSEPEVATLLARAYTKKATGLLAARRYSSARPAALKAERLETSPARIDLLAAIDRKLGGLQERLAAIQEKMAADELEAARLLYYDLFKEAPAQREAVGSAMADLLIRIGDQEAEKKAYAAAADAFTEAIGYEFAVADRVERRLVSARFAQVRQLLEANRPVDAMARLEALLASMPESRAAHYYYGILVEATEADLEKAAGHLAIAAGQPAPGNLDETEYLALKKAAQRALGVRPNRAVAARAIERKRVDGEQFILLETETLKIHHRNHDLAQAVAQIVQRHLATIRPSWPAPEGRPVQGKVEIFLYKDAAEYTARTGQPAWSGAINKVVRFGGAITRREIYTYQTANGLLDTLLPHELTHLLFAEAVGPTARIPLWISEGVAIRSEPAYRHRFYDRLVRSRVAAGDAIPVATLTAMEQYPAAEQVRLYYGQSHSLVKFLIARSGRKAVIGYCQNLGGKQPERALTEAFGFESDEQMARAWKQSLK